MTEKKSEKKLDVKLISYIGLAFFTTGIAWGLYDTQVNQQLQNYVGLLLFVGFWMALDNIIGVSIQPFMGALSDNTRTRFGRRTPYIIVGIIASAIFFALIPTGFGTSFWILLLWMFLFGISMGFYRSQAVALMPDFVRPENRSKANAIINLMGGVGAVVAFSLSYLIDYWGHQVVFLLVSIIMLVALGIFLWKVKETESYSYQLLLEKEGKASTELEPEIGKPNLIQSLKDIWNEDDKSTLFMLLAIFSWFIGYQGIQSLFTIYGTSPETLNLEAGFAGFMLNFVAIPFILFAVPSGIIATKIGRRITIKIGLVLMFSSLVIGSIIVLISPNTIILIIALVMTGIGWALVNVNSIVIIWELAPTIEKLGTYTGVYYFFSVLAAIIGPGIVGLITDLTGISFLLLNAAGFLILAFIFMTLVKRGEVELTEEERIARQKALQKL
ncbi:MAG: MFS transporter [Promethearchaeia archaeon]